MGNLTVRIIARPDVSPDCFSFLKKSQWTIQQRTSCIQKYTHTWNYFKNKSEQQERKKR